MVWSPSLESVKLVPFCVAPPSTAYDVVATPERLSPDERLTGTAPLTQLFDVPLMPVVGAVRSILTRVLSAAVVLPALSLMEALALRRIRATASVALCTPSLR